MSKEDHSSLNNQPERDFEKLSSNPTGILPNDKSSEPSIPKETEKTNVPLDKHGDTWGGGISFENKQVK